MSKKIYSCDKCSKVFKFNYGLKRHINKKYPCVSNDGTVLIANMDKNLTKNEKNIIWRKQKVKCKICEVTYSLGDKSRHIKSKRHLKYLKPLKG